MRERLNRAPTEILVWRRAIQFAPDRSLEPAWFHSFEQSQYEGENSLDLQDIDRPDGSYDFISLSGVLEFVPNDRKAFSELLRIGSPRCIIHCTFTPFEGETKHYGVPSGTFGRYHLYGKGADAWFDFEARGLTALVTTAVDPVTGVREPIHFLCRQTADAELLTEAFAD